MALFNSSRAPLAIRASFRRLSSTVSAPAAPPAPSEPAASDENREILFVPRAVQSPKFRAVTWLKALKERRKQAKLGRIYDSYSFQSVKSTRVTDKTRAESFSYVVLPFRSDEWLLDAYVNHAGRLRIGQLFQDLDALAGVIAYKHCAPAEPVIVTASVDRIYMLKRLENLEQQCIILSGCVTFTGRSSMEITIKASTASQNPEGKLTEADIADEDVFLTAGFTFVARDPETKKAFPINKLLPLTQAEWLSFRRAESYNAAKRLDASRTALSLAAPSEEESRLIHEMWRRQAEAEAKEGIVGGVAQLGTGNGKLQTGVARMADTTVASTLIMQPQYRNRHSYMIFGGYLLRQTFELAYCCAAAFSASVPRFVALDSTTFKSPVPVGSVLSMVATVSYTEHIHGDPEPKAEVQKVEVTKTQTSEKSTKAGSGDSPLPDSATHFSETEQPEDSPSVLSKPTPGTLVQVQVKTAVRQLEEKSPKDSGVFVYSFFVPKIEQPIGSGVNASGYCTVVPETYQEMMEYLEGRRKVKETKQFSKNFSAAE